MKPSHFTLSALLAVLAITAGVAVRLIHINQPLLEFFPPRQTQTAEITRNIYVNGWPDFWTPKVRYFTDGQPIPYVLEFPLYNGIVAALYHLFSPSVILGRLTSLIFFIASSIIFYLIVELTMKQFNNLTIFALLFFTFSPLHILVSRSFQPEELALFLLLLAIYKKSWLIFSLAVLTKLPLAFFAPVMFFSPRHPDAPRHPERSEGSRRDSSDFVLRMTASLLPAALWYYRAGQLTTHPAIARNFDISNWFQPALWLNPKWYFSLFQIEQIWVLTTLGLLFFWIGFWQIISSLRGSPSANRGNPVFWLIWLASDLLYLAIFNYHAMTHEYYHLFLLPPLAVFVATGLKKILDAVKPLTPNFRLIAVSGILMLFLSGLIQPAIKKIISAPKSPEKSEEIDVDRYRLIEDF